VNLAFVVVAVAPVQDFLQQKKQEKSQNGVEKNILSVLPESFYRLGYQMQKSAAYQTAGGQGNQVKKNPVKQLLLEQKRKNPDKGNQAYENSAD